METAKAPLLIKIAIALILAVLAFSVLRSCKLSNDAAELRGQIKVLKADIATLGAENKIAKEAFEKTVAEKDLEIIAWREKADKGLAGIAAGNGRILELEEAIAKLDPAEKDAIIAGQRDLIGELKGNLTLSAGVIEAKDKQILAWEIKFNTCRDLIPGLEREIARLHGLADSQGKLIKDLEGDLRWSRSGGRVKSILIGAAAGYLVFREVRK